MCWVWGLKLRAPECGSWGRSIRTNRELAEDSFHGPTSDLQIHNLFEWGSDLIGLDIQKWFRNYLWSKVKCKSVSCVQLFVTPGTIQSMEFSSPEYWSGQPFPSPGNLPKPGIEPRSPVLQADSLPAEPSGKPKQSSAKWFPSVSHQGHVTSVRTWPPQRPPHRGGPVGASLWCVGSAPGDSKGRPGLRTRLLVHLWELRPSFICREAPSSALHGL